MGRRGDPFGSRIPASSRTNVIGPAYLMSDNIVLPTQVEACRIRSKTIITSYVAIGAGQKLTRSTA